VSEKNISPESRKEASVAEAAVQPSETVSGLTESARRMAEELFRSFIEELLNNAELDDDSVHVMGQRRLRGYFRVGPHLGGERNIVDALRNQEATGRELDQAPIPKAGEDLRIMTISPSEFEKLRDKASQILQDATLAHERIGKDQQEIEQLKMETRAMLKELRAA